MSTEISSHEPLDSSRLRFHVELEQPVRAISRSWGWIDEQAAREGAAILKLKAITPSRWLMGKRWTVRDWLEEQGLSDSDVEQVPETTEIKSGATGEITA